MKSSQIQKQVMLVKGRFAVIHRGTVTIGNESKPVAIKCLRRMYNRHIHRCFKSVSLIVSFRPACVAFCASANDVADTFYHVHYGAVCLHIECKSIVDNAHEFNVQNFTFTLVYRGSATGVLLRTLLYY